MAIRIRNFHQSDLPSLYRICLETGADGADATGTVDEEILGHFFAAPYAVFEPELCFVLVDRGAPCGYILGTVDSRVFEQQMESAWLPALRARYALSDDVALPRQAAMIRAIHAGYRAPGFSDQYPAHLHIDILPVGQGRGLGGKLVSHFLDGLREKQVTGVHLGVSRHNERALAWYPRLGFEVIDDSPSVVYYGMKL